MEVCRMKMKDNLACLLEDSKESAVIVGSLAINLEVIEHKAEDHIQVKMVETKFLMRI